MPSNFIPPSNFHYMCYGPWSHWQKRWRGYIDKGLVGFSTESCLIWCGSINHLSYTNIWSTTILHLYPFRVVVFHWFSVCYDNYFHILAFEDFSSFTDPWNSVPHISMLTHWVAHTPSPGWTLVPLEWIPKFLECMTTWELIDNDKAALPR